MQRYKRVREENNQPVAVNETGPVLQAEQDFKDSLVALMDLAAHTRDQAGFPLTPDNTTVRELLLAAEWQIQELEAAQHTGAADRLRKFKKVLFGVLRAANIKRGILP
jgi:hypothetical protein